MWCTRPGIVYLVGGTYNLISAVSSIVYFREFRELPEYGFSDDCDPELQRSYCTHDRAPGTSRHSDSRRNGVNTDPHTLQDCAYGAGADENKSKVKPHMTPTGLARPIPSLHPFDVLKPATPRPSDAVPRSLGRRLHELDLALGAAAGGRVLGEAGACLGVGRAAREEEVSSK